jgi:hypothetical protein
MDGEIVLLIDAHLPDKAALGTTTPAGTPHNLTLKEPCLQ